MVNAETLVTLEAVLGQFYLAVLVGAYLSDRDNQSVKNDSWQ